MSTDPALAVHALEDLPLIGTLVFVFAMNRITGNADQEELLDALGSKKDGWEYARAAYAFAILASMVATVVPILQKTYWRLRRTGSRIEAHFGTLALVTKTCLWSSLVACLVGVALESHSRVVSVAILLTSLAVIVTVLFYRNTFDSMVAKAK